MVPVDTFISAGAVGDSVEYMCLSTDGSPMTHAVMRASTHAPPPTEAAHDHFGRVRWREEVNTEPEPEVVETTRSILNGVLII